jgi:hypothetical protein
VPNDSYYRCYRISKHLYRSSFLSACAAKRPQKRQGSPWSVNRSWRSSSLFEAYGVSWRIRAARLPYLVRSGFSARSKDSPQVSGSYLSKSRIHHWFPRSHYRNSAIWEQLYFIRLLIWILRLWPFNVKRCGWQKKPKMPSLHEWMRILWFYSYAIDDLLIFALLHVPRKTKQKPLLLNIIRRTLLYHTLKLPSGIFCKSSGNVKSKTNRKLSAL